MVESKQSPITGMDLDSDELRIAKDKARFIKGLTFSINRNSNTPAGEGGNVGVLTPQQSNADLTGAITFPAGNNLDVGFYESKETNEGYCFVWNSNSDHFIYRIKGDDGTCEIVYQSPYLNFQYDPRYFIPAVRCSVHVSCYVGPDGLTKRRTTLMYTDAFQDQRYIVVEDSISTDSFNANTFSFFASNGVDQDRSEFIKLGVPTPLSCIGITPAARIPSELLKQNLMIYKGWQFRVKFIDVWGRESEHGVISDKYFVLVGSGCISGSTGLNRCVDLKFDAGYPLVDKIQIEFRTCTGNNKNLTVDSDWYLYDTIEKYNNCEDREWWMRSHNSPYLQAYNDAIADGKTGDDLAAAIDGKLKYTLFDNTFTYRFCGDKECTPLPVIETGRVQNQLPILSNSLFPLDRGIGLAGNTRGFEPLSCAELDKIDFVVTPPSGPYCPVGLYKVSIYGLIWNPFLGVVSQTQTNIQGSKLSGFGVVDCAKNNPLAYDQLFPLGVRGWIGYMAGTRYNVVSESIDYDPTTDTHTIDVGNSDFHHGHFQMQLWEFHLPPGRYVFRVASHRATVAQNFQSTSTYVVGRTALNDPYQVIEPNVKEIVIEVTNADVEIKANPLKIWDLMRDARDAKVSINDCWANATTLIDSYLYEDKVSKIPIEMASISIDARNENYFTDFTDHNGFFFGASKAKTVFLKVNDVSDCATTKNMSTKAAIDNFNAGGHLKHDELYVYDNPIVEYPDAGRRYIKGKVVLCDNPTVGISGVVVVLTKSAWAITNSKGEYSIIAHQRYGAYASAPANTDDIIISSRGDCRLLRCDVECSTSFPIMNAAYQACGISPRVVTMATIQASINGMNKYGPQTGGRYGGGVVMHDWMGRQSFVQAADKHYMDIPSLNEMKKFDFSKMGFVMDGSIRFPSWVRYISFYITENLNFDDFLSWVVDRFQFVDNSGNVNNAAPTKIRLYYDSLVGYNMQNNLSTNTNWQFFSESENKAVVGDKIEFIMNGDGKWYDTKIEALVTYDKLGSFITIDYTEELKGLVNGALLRFVRPKQCINKFIYFEQCPIIQVNNGIPQVLAGDFNYFDSYFLNRQLPVPVIKPLETDITTNATSGTGTGTGSVTGPNNTASTDPNKNSALQYTGAFLLTAYPFLFESASPSDFWGDHCANRGRVNTKNPFERQYCIGSEIALSKVIQNNSNVNGLNYFDIANAVTFDEQLWGKIMAVLPEGNALLVICEHSNFTVGFNDNTLRIGNDGQVQANSSENKFGKPQRKGGKEYGCLMQDLSTIQKHDSVVTFLDRSKNCLVFHNYSDPTDVAKAFGFKGWINRKIAAQNNYNNAVGNSIGYFIGGIDPNTGEYYLTNVRSTNQVLIDGYVNELTEENVDVSETICIDLLSATLKNFSAFTPEYYGRIEGYFSGANMLALKTGKAFGHNNGSATPTFLNFFGIQTKKVIKMITNTSPEKVKRYLFNEFYCKEHVMIASEVKTESGQLSRIKAANWDKAEHFFFAAFLCDLNTVLDPNLPGASGANALMDGDMLYGRWLSVKYESLDADDAKYCEISGIAVYLIGSEKSAN